MTTGLVTYQNEKPTFDLVRDGIRGNLDVVYRMIDIVRNTDVLDKGFEDFVKGLEVDNNLDSYSDTETTFEFWFNFVKDNVKYIRDIGGKIESLKDARTTIQDRFGDCDDISILNASILSVLGYEPVFVIAKYPDTESYQHVYCVCYVDGVRYVFDQVIPDGNFNDEVQDMQIKEFPVFESNSKTDGVEAIARNAKYGWLETQSNLKSALPLLSSFLPFGFITHTALKGLFSGLNDSQSLSEFSSDISGKLTDVAIKLQNGLIPHDTASSQAHSIYAQLYSYSGDKQSEEFKALDKILTNKVNYIDNYTDYGTVPVSTTNVNLQSYLIYGAVGLGIYFLLRD